jgi:hypothetical protein
MRSFLLAFLLIIASPTHCRLTAQNTSATSRVTELQSALVGSWVGTLEYRDYSEPATSSKRVKLPTWLSIEPSEGNLNFRYIYDDGPKKTVTETSLVHIDSNTSQYAVLDRTGKVESNYAIAGLAELRQGRGILTLTGTGTENNAPVAVRTTISIGRNILEITRETAGSGLPFTFRHAYTLVRAGAPVR